MSKDAIQAVVRELELLPEADQRLVLTFFAKLRQNRDTENTSASKNGPTLCREDGLLVFTGELEQPDTNWVQVVREERDDNLINAALGRAAHA